MVNPVPGKMVTTPYKKRGKHWKACRWHTGQDYAAPRGTRVVAARSGVVRHVNYGRAFGRHQIAVLCDDGTEDFYAHMYQREANSERVEAGQWIGYVGDEGNATGPHLHFERHKTQGQWDCANMDDPMKSHNEGEALKPGKVYTSKLVYKQDDSDSVRRLQTVLNDIKLVGGAQLPITGGYFKKTRDEVSKWQAQKAHDKSITDGSKLTDDQAEQIFAGTGNTVVDDTEPEVDPDLPPIEPAEIINAFGLWKYYSGKPGGEYTLRPDGEWHRLDIKEEASGIKAESSEHRLLYLRVVLSKSRTANRLLEVKFVRANGDATAYDCVEYGLIKDSYPYNNFHMEDGDGKGGQWWVKVTGGKDPIVFTTRYGKQHTFYEDKVEV